MKSVCYFGALCSLLILGLVFSVNGWASNQINSVRVSPAADNTRVVFDLQQAANYSYFSLTKPDRLVIDFKNTSQQIKLPSVGDSPLIKTIRKSKPKNKHSLRLVLELTKSVNPLVFPLAATDIHGHRLVVDFAGKGKIALATPAVKAKVSATPKAPAKSNKGAAQVEQRDVLIAIDPGHGGRDPGSIGPSGLYEKKVTLAISRRLAHLINAQSGMRAVLVRDGDYYVKVSRRPEIARERKADLFISIHADAFRTPQPSGASVWVLSLRRANTEIGKWLEQREKHSQLLGGAAQVLKDTESEKYLAQVLLDMSMEHAMSSGYQMALEVIKQLKPITKLHKRKPQSASFGVLKSPDIPSILVELGFISNPQEEKRLNNSNHQQKLARALYQAVHKYFSRNPPKGTLLAQRTGSNRSHKVVSGDSLSELAQRYQVSVTQLKRHNSLRGDVVRIGQVLMIPDAD